MIAVSVLPWLFVLRDSVSAVMSYGYFVGLFRQEAVTGFSATPNVLAGFLIPGAFFLLAGSGRQRSGLLIATGIVAVYSAVNFFLGSRAPAITALFAMLWLWHRQIHPVRKTTVLAIAAAVVVLLPLVAAIRDLNLDARAVSISTGWSDRMENPLVSAAGEMGSSLSTVAHTMELVPAVREFDLGKSYLYSSLAALPNLFWSVHPTVSHGLLGTWLVWTVDPGRAAVNGGMGFSFLAEAFLNFGWYAAPVALLFIGLALGVLAGWVKNSRDPASLAATACILASALIFARGESASVVRGVVWYSLLPYLAVLLLGRTQRSL